MKKYRFKIYPNSGHHAVFLFCGWRTSIRHNLPISKMLQLHGFSCITYDFADDFFTPNVQWTIKNFLEIKQNLLHQVKQLRQQGCEQFSTFGISLGTIPAFMLTNSSPWVKKIIANLTGADVAEIVWSWDKYYPEFKQKLIQQHLTLPKLKKYCRSVSPINNIDKLKSKQILVYLSESDEVIPYTQGLKLVKSLQRHRYDVQLISTKYFKHTLSGVYHVINYRRITKFLTAPD